MARWSAGPGSSLCIPTGSSAACWPLPASRSSRGTTRSAGGRSTSAASACSWSRERSRFVGFSAAPASGMMTAPMLRELFVQNLALIEDVRVELRPGFCAWTGETGAGKTLLLEALGLLLGERGSADLIRAGADDLRVTGRFELTRPELREQIEQVLGSPLDDDQV